MKKVLGLMSVILVACVGVMMFAGCDIIEQENLFNRFSVASVNYTCEISDCTDVTHAHNSCGDLNCLIIADHSHDTNNCTLNNCTQTGTHTHCTVDNCNQTGIHEHNNCGLDNCTQNGTHTHSNCGVSGCNNSGNHTHNSCGVYGCGTKGNHSHNGHNGSHH